jgi:hypothetical protein
MTFASDDSCSMPAAGQRIRMRPTVRSYLCPALRLSGAVGKASRESTRAFYDRRIAGYRYAEGPNWVDDGHCDRPRDVLVTSYGDGFRLSLD